MNIREAHEKFATDEPCLAYIEKCAGPMAWVRCPTCAFDNLTWPTFDTFQPMLPVQSTVDDQPKIWPV
jgi:hypothetical protein